MYQRTKNCFRSLIPPLLLFPCLLNGGSIFNDFRQELPAVWQSWSHRYTGNPEDCDERPFCMEGTTPIILVHGYLHNNSGWLPFRKALQKENLGPAYAPKLESSAQDIRKSALEIAQLIELAKKESGCSQVILIGHSMGGIICAYCAQHYAPKGSVKAVITLASPLRGTKTASLGFGRAARQMRCDSRFLKALGAQMIYNPKTEYFSFASTSDPVVRPQENAFHKEPDDTVHFHLYKDLGHLTFLFEEDVIRDVISVIHTLDDSRSGDHP